MPRYGAGRATARTLVLAAGVWLWTTLPAAANAPDPERYPEAYENYTRGMSQLFWGTIACGTLMIVAVIAAVVAIIVFFVRRNRRQAEAEAAARGPVETPDKSESDPPAQ